jgi:hypothetical protein
MLPPPSCAGKQSKKFVELLRTDSDNPMWPDPENGTFEAQVGGGRAQPLGVAPLGLGLGLRGLCIAANGAGRRTQVSDLRPWQPGQPTVC